MSSGRRLYGSCLKAVRRDYLQGHRTYTVASKCVAGAAATRLSERQQQQQQQTQRDEVRTSNWWCCEWSGQGSYRQQYRRAAEEFWAQGHLHKNW